MGTTKDRGLRKHAGSLKNPLWLRFPFGLSSKLCASALIPRRPSAILPYFISRWTVGHLILFTQSYLFSGRCEGHLERSRGKAYTSTVKNFTPAGWPACPHTAWFFIAGDVWITTICSASICAAVHSSARPEARECREEASALQLFKVGQGKPRWQMLTDLSKRSKIGSPQLWKPVTPSHGWHLLGKADF